MGATWSCRLTTMSVLALALPTLALGQASVAGVVRDISGAVLPGVTVQVGGPGLTERFRTAVTDGAGEYRLADLRPGTYSVTFARPGLGTITREAVALSGSLTVTVNADMRVGALESTVIVVGAARVVDVRGARQQRVLTRDVIDVVPTGRTTVNLAVLIPGMQLSTTLSGEGQDVGGSTGEALQTLSIHGSRGGDMRSAVDGLAIQSHGPSVSAFNANSAMIQDILVGIAAGSAEQSTGGVRLDIVPREGGNAFSGSLFLTGTNHALQSRNIDRRLRDRGIVSAGSLESNWEASAALGGPLVRHRAWFFASSRAFAVHTHVPGVVRNVNAGNPESFAYAPDVGFRGSRDTLWRNVNGRVSWQAGREHKLTLFADLHDRCSCPDTRALTSPEASADFRFPWNRLVTATYAAPLTDRILVEAGVAHKSEEWGYFTPEGREQDQQLVGVTDLATGVMYRGPRNYFGSSMRFRGELFDRSWRAAVSFATGTHELKLGYQDHTGFTRGHHNVPVADNLSYTFFNGRPIAITVRAPYTSATRVHDGSVYALDRWIWNPLTLNIGLRWEFYRTSAPTQTLGPSAYTPSRHVTYPAVDLANLNDVAPRLGAVYDLFGTGRTAIKGSLSKYVEQLTYSGTRGDAANPAQRTVHVTTRQWNDANADFVPDCDLAIPLANGECQQISNLAFGSPAPGATYNPAVLTGWGKRGYNWEATIGVEHQVWPTVNVEAGYVRRWYGNFLATDNRALAASDFSPFSVAGPTDPRLPAGGGRTIGGLYNVTPAAFARRPDIYLTFASDYGRQTENWQGVDVSVHARLGQRSLVRGGLSTGRRLTDTCEIRAQLPERSPLDPYCRVREPYLAQAKLLGAHTLPRTGVQIAWAFQSIPGPMVQARVVHSAATLAASLGRPFVGATAAVVNVIPTATEYGDRLNQLDLRIGKIAYVAGLMAAFNLDLFNVLNANAVLAENPSFAVYRQPLTVLNPRMVKFSAQIEF